MQMTRCTSMESSRATETIDPRSQSEDLGDDAMKASEYGIKT